MQVAVRTRRTRGLIVVGLMATLFATSGTLCPPSDGGDEPMLRLYHFGQQTPWKTAQQFKNIHSAQLCDNNFHVCSDTEQSQVSPYCSGTQPLEQVEVSLPDKLDSGGEQLQRGRIMFFRDCGERCRGVPGDVEEDTGLYRTGGAYRYWEGAGSSGMTLPFTMGWPVGHIRRYDRGACSVVQTMGPSETQYCDGTVVQNPSFAESFRQAMTDQIKCEDSIRRVATTINENGLYIGSDACHNITGENKDFIKVHYRFKVYPKAINRKAHVTTDIKMQFRLVAKRRSNLLDCPQDCATCGDCRDCRTKQCSQAEDCCDLPGVYCSTPGAAGGRTVYGVDCNANGVCEKESFLDVEDYRFEMGVSEHCKWDPICMVAFLVAATTAAVNNNHPYKKVFAPMIQSLYDRAWGQDPTCVLFSCSSDSICETNSSRLVQGRCGEAGTDGNRYCEFRPMLFWRRQRLSLRS